MNHKKYAVMFLIIISNADISSADSFVFGPVIYNGTKGSSDIVDANFSSSVGDFILHVDNGRDGGYKISSATITLNGEIIVMQNEFNQNVNSINKSIKLKSDNNLQVKLNSKPTGSISLYIHAAPVVEIDFPVKNAYHPVNIPLDGTPVELETAVVGTIKGNVTNVTIRVNNDIFDVPVINGSFYQNVTLIENDNQISVSATDTLGYTGNASIVAFVENTNKELTMPLPPPNPFENDKLGAGLNYTAYLFETQGMDAAVAFISRNPHNIVENGSIRVRIPVLEENETYISMLRAIGIDVLDVVNATDIGGEILIGASLPISKIREAEELDFITQVYVVATPYLESIGEGDAIIGGDKVRSLGFTGLKPDGSKVEVAVIDGPGSSHEAKVMDVIQTIAPGAQVISYSGDWNKGIEKATADGVDIISVSQSAPHLDLDGTDPISKNITLARTNGILYINAAGNWARLHYKGTYQDKNNNSWHEFASFSKGYDETLNAVWSSALDNKVTAYLHLNPDDVDKLDIKLGTNDTEPLLLDSSQDRYSRGVKSITIPVNELKDVRIFVTNSSKYKSFDVMGTSFHIFVYPFPRPPFSGLFDKQNQWVDNYVKESSIPAPATSNYSFTVGATISNLIEPYANIAASLPNIKFKMLYMILMTDIRNTFYQDNLAYFSGQGPVYDAAGNKLIKPDVVAPTFVSTSHGIFGGTSASAPHVAAAAALVLSANPYLTPDEVQQALEESAVELGAQGRDNEYGAGRIDVYEAVQKVLPDLRPSNIQAVRDGATEGFAVKADVNNAGHGVTRNVEVQFLKDRSVFNTSLIPELKAGETITMETKWMAENYGSYNISVIVDPGNRIPELDENNNYANVTVDVTGLPGWGFSKKLSIMGTTAGAQTNYPLKLTVRKGSGTDAPGTVYLGNNVRDNFGDIRFAGSDGVTLLDYWVESYTPGGSAEVWVEVDSIPASPNTVNIYLYYGNPSAISASNGNNTFVFFDDFEDGTYTGWSLRAGSAILGVNNGWFMAQGTSSYGNVEITADNSIVSNHAYELKIKTDFGNNPSRQGRIMFRSTRPYYNYVVAFYPTNIRLLRQTGSYSETELAGSTFYWDDTKVYNMKITGYGNQLNVYINDVLILFASDSTYSSGNIEVGLREVYGGTWKFDDTRVRNYSSPEPTWG